MELARRHEHDAEKDHGPYHAVRHDGNGIQGSEQGPEQDGKTPQKMRAETRGRSRAGSAAFAGHDGEVEVHREKRLSLLKVVLFYRHRARRRPETLRSPAENMRRGATGKMHPREGD